LFTVRPREDDREIRRLLRADDAGTRLRPTDVFGVGDLILPTVRDVDTLFRPPVSVRASDAEALHLRPVSILFDWDGCLTNNKRRAVRVAALVRRITKATNH
jgi:hypothetical protein